MGFSRQEYLSGLPFPSPGIFLTQGSNLRLLHWQILYHCAIREAPQSLGTGAALAGGGSSQCCHTGVFSSSTLAAQRLGGSRLPPVFFSFHLQGKRVNSLLENKAGTVLYYFLRWPFRSVHKRRQRRGSGKNKVCFIHRS